MKRVIAAGLALSMLMLLPATLPNVVHVSYAVPPPSIVQVHTPFVMAPVTPLSEGIGARMTKDITLSTDTAANDLIFLSRWELLNVLAQTSWRSYVTAHMYYVEEIDRWFYDDFYAVKLYDLMMCESSGRIDAIGDIGIGTGISVGLFQINTGYWPELAKKYHLFRPVDNAQAAYEIWEIQGWDAWSCHDR